MKKIDDFLIACENYMIVEDDIVDEGIYGILIGAPLVLGAGALLLGAQRDKKYYDQFPIKNKYKFNNNIVIKYAIMQLIKDGHKFNSSQEAKKLLRAPEHEDELPISGPFININGIPVLKYNQSKYLWIFIILNKNDKPVRVSYNCIQLINLANKYYEENVKK